MTYQIIADRINIRSSIENNKPRVVIRATAAIANKKHVIEYTKNPDGSFKTLKSMFTPHCIESIKKQSKNKGVFVDIQHELAREATMKEMVKGKFTPEEQKRFDNMLKRKRLPMMKMNNIDILDDKLDLEAEMNASFPEVDEEHKRLYDAVVYSLNNKFLNGISVNFGDFKMIKDDKGDMVIDDVDVLGFSCLDTPSEHMNNIYEVAIREIVDKTGEAKMEEDEKKKIEEEKAKLAEDRKKLDEEKAEIQKKKDEEAAEAKKAEDIKKGEEEQKKIEEDLAKKTEEAKKAQEEADKANAELNSIKGRAAKDKGNPNANAGDGSKPPTEELYKENIQKITAEHDETMKTLREGKTPIVDKRLKGMGELIDLQARTGNPTADLSEKQEGDIRDSKPLERGNADIITSKVKPNN